MTWTLQSLIDGKMSLAAFCQSCDHNALLDLQKLQGRLGRDAPAMADDLKPKLRCAACGSKQIALTYTPSGNDRMAPPNRYAKAKGV